MPYHNCGCMRLTIFFNDLNEYCLLYPVALIDKLFSIIDDSEYAKIINNLTSGLSTFIWERVNNL